MNNRQPSHSRKNVLFVSAFHAPFIQDDLDMLTKKYNVRAHIGSGFRQIFNIIIGAMRSEVLFCWFASVYASIGVIVSRMFGVRSIIIIGGVDAAKDADLNYGIWLSPWRAKFVRYAFRNADHILVVDPSLKEEAIRLAEYSGENIRCVPTGYDSNFWKPMGDKEPTVLTVAVVRKEGNLRRKGIDTLIAAAYRLPDISFVVIGIEADIRHMLKAPQNITFIDPIRRQDILPYYQRAKVYCQPSRREGLPNALCEGMLCGCIPVVTEVSGNPTAVGDTGFMVPPGDDEALAAGILKAFMLDESSGLKARTRIVSLFPKEKREADLIKFIEGSAS